MRVCDYLTKFYSRNAKIKNIVMLLIIWIISILENASSHMLSENEEKEYRSYRFSLGFHLLLPVVGLGFLIIGRRQIFEKILLQLDKKYLTVLCPSFIKKENLLKWACSRLPPTWSSHSMKTLSGGIKELWTDGSLLCTLINTAIPGACPNPHRHWKQSPVHGQALAYKYFGIAPIFSDKDLRQKFGSGLERKFIRYLNEIQQAINKVSENTDDESKFSSRYIVRGMGLFSGEQHKVTPFYIYLNENCEEDYDKHENVIIQIKGPYGTYGEVVAPKIVSKKRKPGTRRKQERRQSIQFIENFIQSNTWNFARAQKKHINEGIEITTTMENDRIKVCYTPTNYGMYEINMICNGELLKGCPFNVHIFINELDNTELKKENLRKHTKHAMETEVNIMPNFLESDEIIQKDNKNAVKQLPPFKTDKANNETQTKEIATNDITFKNLHNICKSSDPDLCEPLMQDDRNILTSVKDSNNSAILRFVDNENNSRNQSTTLEFDKKNKKIKTDTSTLLGEVSFVDKDQTTINKNDILEDCNKVKINNDNITSLFDHKSLINESENRQLESKQKGFVVEPKYINTINIDKIKIPDLFTVNQVNPRNYRLEDKYYKNILNESNRVNKQNFNTLTDLEFHKNSYDIHDSALEESKKNKRTNYHYLEPLEKDIKGTVPERPEYTVYNLQNILSTAAEKRKKFSQANKFKGTFGSGSKNSSFSDENDKELIGSKRSVEELDGINIRNNLWGSVNDSLTDTWSLCSTASLPNLSMESDYSYVMSVKDKKNFWENISSRSSSSVSTISLSPKKTKKTLEKLDRSRLVWSEPKGSHTIDRDLHVPENIHKSADDILSITSFKQEYSSDDNSLDKYDVLSIEQRKRLLLKQFNENENVYKENKSKRNNKMVVNYSNPLKNVSESRNLDIQFTPISEKIRKYHSALELSHNSPKELPASSKKLINTPNPQVLVEKVSKVINTKHSVKRHTQFKRTVNYFKKLEVQSQTEPVKPKNKRSSQHFRNNLPPYRSESLNGAKVSQKFLINNLYQDVFGNDNGSFKGTPNKSALVEALATFPRNQNNLTDNENDIKFDVFKKLGKIRKRKSLKSVFDVHY